MSNQNSHNGSLPRDKLLEHTLENSANSIFWIDQDGKIIFANTTAAQKLGYTKDELLKLSVHDIDPGYPKENWATHWQALKYCKDKTIESYHLDKSGRKFPVEIHINHTEIEEREFHTVYVRDVSEHKRIEQLLRESEERFRLTLDATSNGMWDKNLLTGETYYGANWASSLGYKDEDLEQGRISWQSLLHPDDKEKTLKALQDHLDGKTDQYVQEFRLLNSNKQWQWTLARGKVVQYDEDGVPLRFVGTQTNIAERKRAEEQLQHHSEKIRLFAYSIAHDLKNPSIAINGLSKRLQEKCGELSLKQITTYCERIRQSSMQIEQLVDTINVFLSTKEAPVQIETIALQELYQTVEHEFSLRLQKRNVALCGCQSQCHIQGDRLSLLRILRNLVDNSIKYGGDNLSEISIEYKEMGGHHVITVKDDGVGLEPTEAIDVFAPFERKSTSRGVSGTGLGLAIAREVAKQHKGSVWTEPASKGGVKFCFSISKKL